VIGLVVGGALLGVVLLASLAVGARPMAWSTAVEAVTSFDPADDDHLVVRELRMPRTVIGLLAGVALGLAGALMQGVTRNPLADPGLLGVNAGAALAVVIAINVFGVATLAGYVWFAFGGAGAAAVTVYLLGATGRDGATPVKLALAGAALTALLGSVTTAILLLDATTLDQFRFWAVGSLDGRGADIATQAAPFVVVGVLMAFVCGRMLNALALGDDVARSLGQRVGIARAVTAAAVVVLAGTATAAAGPIVFVGLTVPHVARALTGPDNRWVLAYAAVLAPILLVGADVIGRVVARPSEVQVGIVTALLGAPVFIALVRRRRLAEV
jgi:iron complex transport system permease protein